MFRRHVISRSLPLVSISMLCYSKQGSSSPRVTDTRPSFVVFPVCSELPFGRSARCAYVPMCPRTDMSTYRYVHVPMCPCTDMSTYRYIHVPMRPRTDVRTYRCVHVPICPCTDVSTYRCTHGPMCPRPDVPTSTFPRTDVSY